MSKPINGPLKRIVSGMSRRGFLKGAGVAAAGAAIADGALETLAQEEKSAVILGPGPVPVTLKVNGQDKRFELEPRTTLAEALRIHADMTGTKVVCVRGACSACTVWLDGTSVISGMTLALDGLGW